jgi:subtilisin family serine protease
MIDNNKYKGPRRRFVPNLFFVTLTLIVGCAPQSPGPDPVQSNEPESAGTLPPTAQAAPSSAKPLPLRFVPGEFIVKFKSGISKSSAARTLGKATLVESHESYSVPGLHLVRVGGGEPGALAFKAQLSAEAGIEYIEPNFIYHASAVPNDPDYPRLWAMHNTGQQFGTTMAGPDIGAEQAWDITTGSDDIVVAVIDSGIDYNHEDLAANIWRNDADCDGDGIDDDANGYIDDCHGIDTADSDSDPMDVEGHGTHVSGTIGAVGNNGIGVAGVAWKVKMMACRFLDANGYGSTADAIKCLDYVARMKDRGVNIIATNNSWGSSEDSRALEDAIRAQRDRSILFVAAAGNERQDNDVMPDYPCAQDVANVICVASASDVRDIFSNWGRGIVLLGAPGANIYSTIPGNRYDWKDGTSMATPHVVGALVLLKAQDPTRTPWELRNLLAAGAVHESAIPTIVEGRLSVRNSLTCNNSTVLARLRPMTFEPLSRAPGDTVTIRALHVRCAHGDGDVTVNVSPGGEIVTLRDDGAPGDEVAGDGVYSGRWVAHGDGEYTFNFPAPETETFVVDVDPSIKPGFPLSTYAQSVDNIDLGKPGGYLAIGNIAGDAKLEILTLAQDFGPLYAWNAQGQPMPGWPRYENGDANGLTLGNFDNDFTDLEPMVVWGIGTEIYQGDGSPIPGWPQSPGSLLGQLAAGDLDGDGIDEVLSLPARRADGTLFRTDVTVPAYPPIEEGASYTPEVGDLDADGHADMVNVSSRDGYKLWVSDSNGVRRGFPVAVPGGNSVVSGIRPLIGDVDGDGSPNIVLGSGNYDTNRDQVQIFDNRGRLLRTLQSASYGVDSVVLADMDADGIPEIVKLGASTIEVWRGDGTPLPGWPRTTADEYLETAPAIGDIDGDGKVDLVAVGFQYDTFLDGRVILHAFHADATYLPGFPRTLHAFPGGARPPAIADLDLDGRNDLVVSYGRGLGLRETVFAYDLHGAGPYGPVESSQHSGDARHSGYYQTGKNLPNHAIVSTQVFGAGKIVAANGGIDCRGDCIERFAKGTTVTLAATALAGGTFERWRGACAGQGNPCTLPVTQSTETSADFTSMVSVTRSGSGSGSVTSSIPGIDCGGDCSEAYPARSYVVLTATAPAGNAFESWGGACSGTQPTCEIFVDDVKAVTARFTNHQTLTVTRLGTGSASITSNPAGLTCNAVECTGEFTPGSTVAITVTPAADSYYYSVEYPYCNIFTQPCQVTMNGPQSLRINVPLKPVMTVTVRGNGRVKSDPAGLDCTADCSVPLEVGGYVFQPIADAGWHLARWEGDCSGTSGWCNLYMGSDRAITAVFEQNPALTLNFAGSGSGSINVSGVDTCSANCTLRLSVPRQLTLVASPDVNSTFSGWTGACSGTQSTCAVSYEADMTLEATFTRVAPPSGTGSGSGNSSGGKGGGSIGSLELLVIALALAMRLAKFLGFHVRYASAFLNSASLRAQPRSAASAL